MARRGSTRFDCCRVRRFCCCRSARRRIDKSLSRENATEEELEVFALTLLNNITATKPINKGESSDKDELLRIQAIERIIKSAEFWELTRMRCEFTCVQPHPPNNNRACFSCNSERHSKGHRYWHLVQHDQHLLPPASSTFRFPDQDGPKRSCQARLRNRCRWIETGFD